MKRVDDLLTHVNEDRLNNNQGLVIFRAYLEEYLQQFFDEYSNELSKVNKDGYVKLVEDLSGLLDFFDTTLLKILSLETLIDLAEKNKKKLELLSK